MKNYFKQTLNALFVIAFTICLNHQYTFAQPIYVNPGTDLVQGAVSSANIGDTIILKTGVHKITYAIVINTTITLKGEGWQNTFLEKHNGINSSSTAIRINEGADGCTFSDFNLRGRGQGGSGILCYSEYNTFKYVDVHNCGSDSVKASGILLHNSDNNDVRNCIASYNKKVGFSQFNSKNNYFKNCTGNNNDLEGMTIDCGSHNSQVEYCTFKNNCGLGGLNGGGVGGIGIDQSNGAWFEYNTVVNSKGNHGVTIQNNCGTSDGVRIRYNTIETSGKWGIYINNCTPERASTNTGLDGNTFVNNTSGDIKWCIPNSNSLASDKIVVVNEFEELIIYPNPANDFLNVHVKEGQSIKKVEIYSLQGQLVESQLVQSDESKFKFNLDGLQRGTYLYKVITTNGQSNGKFVLN